MLTRRMAAPMMRRGGRRMRQMQELQVENAILRDTIDNMVRGIQHCTVNDPNLIDEDFAPDGTVPGLDWLRLHGHPEPHGAANDTPGSQPEPYDTKSPKSITSAVSKEAE